MAGTNAKASREKKASREANWGHLLIRLYGLAIDNPICAVSTLLFAMQLRVEDELCSMMECDATSLAAGIKEAFDPNMRQDE